MNPNEKNNNIPEPQDQRTSSSSAPRRKPKDKADRLFAALPFIIAFPIAIIYLELITHIAAFSAIDMSYFAYVTFFSISGGLLMVLLATFFDKKVNYIISLVLLGTLTLLCCVQVVYSAFFGDFFQLATLGMAGNILDYMDNTIKAIFANIHWIILLFVPFVLFAVFGRGAVAPEKSGWMLRGGCAALSALFLLFGSLYVNAHDDLFGDRFIYREGFQVKDSIGKFGVLTTARLELQYMLFGIPEADMGGVHDVLDGEITTSMQGVDIFSPTVTTSPENNPLTPESTGTGTVVSPDVTGDSSGTQSGGETTTEPSKPPMIDRSPQRLDIDFDKLIAEAKAAGKFFRKYVGNALVGNVAAVKKMIGSASSEAENAVANFFNENGIIYLAWPQAQTKPDGDTNRAVLNAECIKILKIEQVQTDAKNKLIKGSETLIKTFV